jgi:energy-coupling factor transporter ATP-binding protein EcfA2
MANEATQKMAVSKTDAAVEIIGMNKWYGEFHVLRDINLKVMKGERIVIAGPSGSGKSTMIRCINRLEEHQKGRIVVDGIPLTNDLKRIDEVPASDHSGKLHARSDLGAQDAEEAGRGSGDAFPQARQDSGTGQQISGSAFGRPAAARGDCAGSVHEAEDHAV